VAEAEVLRLQRRLQYMPYGIKYEAAASYMHAVMSHEKRVHAQENMQELIEMRYMIEFIWRFSSSYATVR